MVLYPGHLKLFHKLLQSEYRTTLTEDLRKAFHYHECFFQIFGKTHDEIDNSILNCT